MHKITNKIEIKRYRSLSGRAFLKVCEARLFIPVWNRAFLLHNTLKATFKTMQREFPALSQDGKTFFN